MVPGTDDRDERHGGHEQVEILGVAITQDELSRHGRKMDEESAPRGGNGQDLPGARHRVPNAASRCKRPEHASDQFE